MSRTPRINRELAGNGVLMSLLIVYLTEYRTFTSSVRSPRGARVILSIFTNFILGVLSKSDYQDFLEKNRLNDSSEPFISWLDWPCFRVSRLNPEDNIEIDKWRTGAVFLHQIWKTYQIKRNYKTIKWKM